ncbi:hypothetical protein GGG16DRAFT_104217 [Schizophyllum commune]|nr:hypothetical protein K525DRAFT_253482 [Schizophyllum commune Loenen D]
MFNGAVPLVYQVPDGPHLPPYASDATIKRAKLRVLSYELNPRNIESPVYSLSDKTLTQLFYPCRDFIDNWPQHTMSCSRDWFKEQTTPLYDELKRNQPPPSPSESSGPQTRSATASAQEADVPRREAADAGRAALPTKVVPHAKGANEQNDKDDDSLGEDIDGAYETEDEDEYDDNMSLSSFTTQPDATRIDLIPDFVLTFPIDVRMSVPRQEPAAPPLTAETTDARRTRRHAAAYYVYDGRFLVHDAPYFIEEDKKHVSRRLTLPYNLQELPRARSSYFKQAQSNLMRYMFLYFLLNPHCESVVVRAVSGTAWKWANIERDKVPLYFIAPRSTTSIPQVAQLRTEKQKASDLEEYFEGLDIHEVGTQDSDNALTAMRTAVLENIRRYAPSRRRGASTEWM